MEPQGEALDRILQLLCSGDETNEELAFLLAQSQGINLEQVDWAYFLVDTPLFSKYKNQRLSFRDRLSLALEKVHKQTGLIVTDKNELTLTSLPPALPYFPHLTNLYIQRASELRRLPDWIGKMPRLESLHLLYLDALETLPGSLSQIPGLLQIYIHDCCALTLDEPWETFPRLRVLSIQQCAEVRQLPCGLERSPELQNLSLYRLLLQELPDFLAECPRLEILELNRIQLQVDRPILLAPSVRQLGLAASDFTHFPRLEPAQGLTDLNLANNAIRRIPDKAILSLPRLERLSLSNNQLDKLPDALGSLPSLRRLDLSQNRLRELPASFAQLTRLENLYLKSNPFNPKEIHRWRKLLPHCRITADY